EIGVGLELGAGEKRGAECEVGARDRTHGSDYARDGQPGAAALQADVHAFEVEERTAVDGVERIVGGGSHATGRGKGKGEAKGAKRTHGLPSRAGVKARILRPYPGPGQR